MYRTVKELNENELNELRNNLYWHVFSESNLDEKDITNEMLFKYFNGTTFVEGDFFCNQ
jgi:hypothetical protein